jgi:hypothetical protein
MEEAAIRDVVTRLSRPHPSGGKVIERAAILAEGANASDVVAWIIAHDGEPEAASSKSAKGGLFGSRINDGGGVRSPQPLRYVLPAAALASAP